MADRILEILRTRREEVMALAARHGARDPRVFGSVARGEERPDSDVDLLVGWEEGRSLFDLAGLKLDMEALLQRPVEIISEKDVHWSIRDSVLREAMPL
ncbi:MAG: nucleotidyltransferase family protein [Rhodospirillaceae bacterium]